MANNLMYRGSATNVRANMPFDQVVSIMRQRRSQDSVLINQMIEIRDRYNGVVVLPIPDVEGSPLLEPPVPRLIAQSIDGNAMRAASPNPTIVCPALHPGQDLSTKRAETRRRRLYASWKENQVAIKLGRSYRHLAGYGTCCWVAMPDNKTGKAKIELRDPLTAYPELRDPSDIRDPKNVGFVFGRSIDWITLHFPTSREFFFNAAGKEWDTLWDVVEWIDQDEIIIGILGPRMPAYSPQDARPYGYSGFELCRFPNKAGMVPVVIPRRVTLDMVMGQMSTMIGTVDLHARMTALEVLAAEKHVFPDLVMISEQNQQAQVVSGNWRDGRTGEVNTVDGARGIQYLTTAPNPYIHQTIQELETAIRQSGGASGMFGGDNPGGLRTGAALSTMGSFSIDPAVMELQRIQEQALSCLNEAVLAIEKGYYPDKKQWVFTGLQGDAQMVEYTPGKDFETLENHVSYPIPGADISQMSVAIAQLTGSGLMSKHTGRVKHPFIDDADLEESLIAQTMAQSAVSAGFLQQVSAGSVPLVDAVRVLALMKEGKSFVEAITQAQKEAQARQATQAPPPGTGQASAPQSQPGLSMPGAGVEQPPGPTASGGTPGGASIPAPPLSLANYHSLTRDLNAPPPTPPTGGPAGA